MESINDILGSKSGGSDKLPIKKINDLLGKKLVLNDIKILKDFPSKFGTADRTIFTFSEKLGGDVFQVWTSSRVMTERGMQLKELGKLPITATIIKKTTSVGYYFTIE
jgi:hypothetical protein